MIKTLKESKAKLSELVELASQGEEVVITVRGKPKARLGPIDGNCEADRSSWGRALREGRAKYSTGKRSKSGSVLDELRDDRS